VGLMLLVFLTVTLGLAAGYQALSGLLFAQSTQIRRRMADEFGQNSQAPQSQLFKGLDQLDLPAQTGPGNPLEARGPKARQARRSIAERLQELLDSADIPLTPRQLHCIALCLGLALASAGYVLGQVWLAVPCGLAGLAAPLVIVLHKRRARRAAYLRQLPGAFELMARVVRAGQSVPQAFQSVADAMEDPVAGEFSMCQKHQNLGLRPEIAYPAMARRSGILELRIFAMAMLIQRQTGGNLSDVLERLAGLVRARLRFRERVRTFTAEGRLQGWTLVVLPFLAFGVMLVANRQYAEVLLEHVPILVGMVVSMGVGVFWIRKIVDIDL
jgi:tight adherence protein B